MGLERVTAVLQHVHCNYEIDTVREPARGGEEGRRCAGAGDCDKDSPSLKVIADHIRACTFTVVDGVIPSNDGRGYVLRAITRRAIRHGYKLGARKPFFHALVARWSRTRWATPYPEPPARHASAHRRCSSEGEGALLPDYSPTAWRSSTAALGRRSKADRRAELAFKLHDHRSASRSTSRPTSAAERGVTGRRGRLHTAAMSGASASRRGSRAKFKLAGRALAYSWRATTFHGYDELRTKAR
jgi:alanyl-tRNA synthetase